VARRHTWSRFLGVALALLAWLSAPAVVRAQAIGANASQCANRLGGSDGPINDCAGDAWVSGSVNHNRALYREGDFVPMRTVLTRLVADRRYTLRIGYDAVVGGLHSYDYLGSVDGTVHAGQQIVPCTGVAETLGPHRCGLAPHRFRIPTDTDTTFPHGSQAAGYFAAWGARIELVAYVDPTPITVATPGTVERQIDVTFVADGTTVVLAWGSHIASVLDWGAGRTFASAGSGASFHVRLALVHEHGSPPQSTGGQALNVHVSALAPTPSPFTTQVAPPSVAVGENVTDTASLTGRSGQPVLGAVRFFVCGPAVTPPDCRSGGASTSALILLAPTGMSSASTASISFVPLEPGRYCFRAEFTPGADSPYSPAVHTNTTTECFVATLAPPFLTVTKLCVPENDPGLFNLLLNGGLFGTAGADVRCGESRGAYEQTFSSYVVGLAAGTGTNLDDYTSTIGGDCHSDGSITFTLPLSKTCVIVSVIRAFGGSPEATLTLTKACVPPNDPGQFEFHIDASPPVADLSCGESTTAPIVLAPGTHTVRETGVPPTSTADYSTVISGDCAANGSITLASGEDAHCTFTNSRILPTTTLRIDKACAPASDTGHFNLTINGQIAGTGRNVGCGGTTGAVTVNPGSFTVGESGASGTHLAQYDVVIGSDCAPDGTITVAAGEQAICLITNVRKGTPYAELAVDKICIPPHDGGHFNLTIDGQTSPDRPCGHRFGPVVVSPGAHRVSESAGTGTSLSDYTTSIGGGCAPDGSVTLSAGQSVTCTITNVRKVLDLPTAQITLVKQCRPASQAARFHLTVDQTVFQDLKCGQSTGPVIVSAGIHAVGEVAVAGPPAVFTTIVSGDCAPTGAITLTAGQHASCTVTNERTTSGPNLLDVVRPPLACYELTAAPRTVTIGERVPVTAHVHLKGRPIEGVRVYAAGPGVSAVQTTGPTGHARFVLTLRRAGILTLRIRKPYACPPRDPQKVGIIGVTVPPTPSVTG
jgi:hypothetical protein